MTVNTSTKNFQLRLGVESGATQQDGVLVFDDIPLGATVHARVDRPTELGSSSVGTSQSYAFELAPPPAAHTVGGATFGRNAGDHPAYPAADAPQSSRQRTLLVSGGQLVPEQHEPAWAAFSTPVIGALVQRGQATHTMIMPGHASLTPGLAPGARNLLRMRWTGSSVTGATLDTVSAAKQSSAAAWVSAHINLVPGSISVTLPTSSGVLRDTGKGRLVGPDGDGTVDYLTGAFSLNFNVAETGAVTVDYEHSCDYAPLDVTLTFDPLQAH